MHPFLRYTVKSFFLLFDVTTISFLYKGAVTTDRYFYNQLLPVDCKSKTTPKKCSRRYKTINNGWVFVVLKIKSLVKNFFFPIDISLIQSLDILLLSTSKANTTHTLYLQQFYLATNYKFTLSTRIKRTYFLLFQLPLFHSHTDQYRYTIDPEQRNILNNVTVMRRVNT